MESKLMCSEIWSNLTNSINSINSVDVKMYEI